MSDVHEYYSTCFTDLVSCRMDMQYPNKRQKYGHVGSLDGFILDPVQYRGSNHGST